MKAEQLWASILQEAIQGKLVPQLESEPEVNYIGEVPEDIPFAIPEKWKWAKLGDLVVFNPKVALDDKLEATFLPMAAVSAGYENKVNTKERRFWKKIKTGYSKFADGDIIMAKITPCFQNLKSAICRNLYNGVGAGSTEFHVIRPNSLLNPEYLLIFLKSPYLITYGIENFKGTAGQQRIGTTDLKKCFVPLPPLEEQRRIVACIQGLRSYIGSYQQEERQLAILQSSFREKLRASILQEAIQGKLVPQLESEPEPDINDIDIASENVPFSIPKKWKWVRFGSIGTFSSPRRIHKSQWRSHGIPFLRARELANLADTGILENELFIDEEIFEERKFKGEVAQVGDLVFTAVGTLGKCYVVKRNDIFFCKDTNTLRFSNHRQNPEFLKLLFTTPYMQACFKNEAKGSTVKNLTIGIMSNILLPLPPVEEQKRIVDKVNRIFSSLNLIS